MGLKSLIESFMAAFGGKAPESSPSVQSPAPANATAETAQTLAENPSDTPAKVAKPAKSPSALNLVITSDVGGTIVKPDLQYNWQLLTYLFDAAENGHEVIVCTIGNLQSVEDVLTMAEMKLNRDCPPNLSVMSKWDMKGRDIEADIAFDDQDFTYLPKPPGVYGVIMAMDGTPSTPWAKLRALAGLPEAAAPSAKPAPAP